jgi:hypothetical protein
MRIRLANTLGLPAPLLPDDNGSGTGGDAEGGDGSNAGGAGKTDDKGSDKGDGDRKFTQAEIDKIVGDRVRRAESKYGDYDKLKSELEELRNANKSDNEKAIDKARSEGESAATARLIAERVLDKVEIAAAGTWADTTDARLRLSERARSGEFIDKKTSAIDTDAIKAAVADELKKAPHLAAPSNGTGRPRRDDAQGNGNGKPSRGQGGREEALRRFGQRQQNT